ncbi:MAG: PH domain-containing protein [Lapillicoccus sp.]
MGFPENVLTRDERVVRSLHPHWLTVIGPSLVGVILVAAAVFASVVTPDDGRGNLIQWVCVGLAVVIGIPLVLAPFLRWRTTHYVITTHRVMVRRGILSKAGKDITLSKITDVSFHQTLLDRIIKSGSLSIESAGDSADEDLRNIPHSDEVQQLINHLIDQDATQRAQRSRGGDDSWSPGVPGDPERPLRPRISEE